MKKIILLLNIVVFSLLVACNPNEYATFNDKDAFVAFGGNSYSISEQGGTLKIPVTLASVKGIQSTVTVKAVDGTAKAGVDFNVKKGSLDFNADTRTAYVEIEIVNRAGEYTGDTKFTVTFENLGGVNAGNRSSVSVTINDEDHPLSFILGDYTFTGTKYGAAAPSSYTCTILKDAADDSKVWFYDLMGNPSWAGMDIIYYGVVNPEKTTITIPMGQESEYKYGGSTPVKIHALDADFMVYDNISVVVNISDGGKTLTVDPKYGFYFLISGAGSIGTWLPGITAVKD